MRYIRTANKYVEFIEASSNGNILSSRGFQFGELYFQIKNSKVTFYLNDQENPWRNDVWTINIPLIIDGVVYADEDSASAALKNIMGGGVQEQINALSDAIAAEVGRAEQAEDALDDAIDDETDRAMSAETFLQTEVNSISGAVAAQDAIISGVTNDINNEISARTSADEALAQRVTTLEVGKADANSVYTKNESDNKYATKEYMSGFSANYYDKNATDALLADKADKANAVSTALYNSQSKTIDFKNISGNVIASIDARDFIKDGMVDNVSISGSNLVITFNTDAGKEPISIALSDIFDPNNYYTKNEVDSAITSAVTAVEQQIPSLSGYATEAFVSGYTYDKQTIDDRIASGGTDTGTVQTMIDESISGKADSSAVTASLLEKVNVVDNQVDGYGTISSTAETYDYDFSADTYANAAFYRESDDSYSDRRDRVYGRIVIIDENDNVVEDYTVPSNQQTTSWNPNSQYFTVVLRDKDYVAIQTNEGYRIKYTDLVVSSIEAVNSTKYYVQSVKYPSYQSAEAIENNIYPKLDETESALTEHVSNASIHFTTGDVQTLINQSTSGLQPTLSAGTNVSINDNVISATDTTYSAGSGISITNNVISVTGGTEGITSAQCQTLINQSTSGLQPTLSAGTGISIVDNVISATGGPSGVTSGEVQSMIDESISGKTDNSSFTAHTADTTIHFTTGDVQTQINNSISGKADTTAVTQAISSATSGLQQTLSAGTNVQINNNVISATDTKYTAGNGIDITNNVISTTGGSGVEYSAGTNVQINNHVISATDTTYTAGDGISISNGNVISTVTKFSCVSESEWSSISGNPQSNTVYLIY